jgi:Tfp pilus assembly protein PilP
MRFGKQSRWLIAALVCMVLAAPDAFAQAAKPPAEPGKSATVTGEDAARPSVVGRRDPFAPLVARVPRGGQQEPPECRETGKKGLVITTLRVDGVVRAPSGIIAVVSNPQRRVYFLRDGEEVCNGRVGKVSMEGITFVQTSRDAFGKATQQTISKPLYPSAGVQR